MKLYTPENVELIEVKSVEAAAGGLVIDGQIMGAMPMKAVLTPRELRRALLLLTPRTIWAIVVMFFRR